MRRDVSLKSVDHPVVKLLAIARIEAEGLQTRLIKNPSRSWASEPHPYDCEAKPSKLHSLFSTFHFQLFIFKISESKVSKL